MADIRTGMNPTQIDTVAQFPLGTEADHPGGGQFNTGKRIRYVKASSAVSAGNAVVLDTGDTTGTEPAVVVPASALNQVVAGIAETAIANGSFGWVTVRGRVASATKTATVVTAGDTLSTTATAGALALANSTSATALAVGSGLGVQALDSSDSNSTTIEVVLT